MEARREGETGRWDHVPHITQSENIWSTLGGTMKHECRIHLYREPLCLIVLPMDPVVAGVVDLTEFARPVFTTQHSNSPPSPTTAMATNRRRRRRVEGFLLNANYKRRKR